MEPGSALPLASDDNEDREYLTKLSISELISNLRTAFRMADYDLVEEVLVEKETKLKAKINVLTDKLELERLERMSVQDELRKQCEMRKDAEERYEKLLEVMKKDNDLDDENADESWKKKFKELSELQGNIDLGVSNKVIGEKDNNDVDICDNERENITAGTPPSQRKDLRSVNSHLSVAEVTRQYPDSPNKAVLGTSGVFAEDIDKLENNEVDIPGDECRATTAGTSPCQRKTDNCGDALLAVDDDARQSSDTPNIFVLSETTIKNAVDIHDDEYGTTAVDTSPCQKKTDNCGNAHLSVDDECRTIAADTSPSKRKKDDCENAHLSTDDNARQSLDTPNTAMPSEATIKNAVDIHDDECRTTAADTSPCQRKTGDCGIALLTVDDDARLSLDTPNTVVPSEATIKNGVDIYDDECISTAAKTSPCQSKTDDCENAHLAVDDDGARQSPDTPSKVVPSAIRNIVDIHDDDECRITAGNTSPSQRKVENCGNTCRQSPDTPNTVVQGASANVSSGSHKAVIEIKDSDNDDDVCISSGALNGKEATRDIVAVVDGIVHLSLSRPSKKAVIEIKDSDNDDDDDDECITSGALKGKEATHDIAAAVDNVGHSNLSGTLRQKSNASPVGVNGMIETLKRKWFPKAGNSYDGLNKNPVDGSDTDGDSSSSTSSLESGFNKVYLPSKFLCSTGGKRRKT